MTLTESDREELFASLPVSMQQAVARGDVDLEELLERVTSTQNAELCPRCCIRPITVIRTGLCNPCHQHALTAAHREIEAELLANRERATVRKSLQRTRDKIGAPADPAGVRRIGFSVAFGVRADGRPIVGEALEADADS